MPAPHSDEPTPGATPARPATRHHGRRLSDASPLNLLLIVPIVLCLAVPLYNRTDPTLFGIPFFYWFQLAIIPVGVTCTMAVFLAHKGDGRG